MAKINRNPRPTTVAGRAAAKKACETGLKVAVKNTPPAPKQAQSVLEFLTPKLPDADVMNHPLFGIFVQAIEQAMYGKGVRHGGAMTPFTEQPWAHYTKMHGRGFATGQAAKKLEEASALHTGEPFEREVFGAMVYAGMSILKDRGQV